MSEERKNPVIWGCMLLVCALGCVSLRNNPALGISPLAIGIIEAMKIMNEIEAEFDCRITKAIVSDGQPVEFGMALFEVEKI